MFPFTPVEKDEAAPLLLLRALGPQAMGFREVPDEDGDPEDDLQVPGKSLFEVYLESQKPRVKGCVQSIMGCFQSLLGYVQSMMGYLQTVLDYFQPIIGYFGV